MTRQWHLLVGTVGASIALSAILLVWSVFELRHIDRDRHQAELATCKRGNIVRGNQNVIIAALQQQLHVTGLPPLTPLVDCEKSVP